MPDPSVGESKEQFINRCMAFPDMQSYDKDQRFAICNSKWDKKDMESNIENKEYKEFTPSETFDVGDVEIFSVGNWNGDIYTQQDLDDMVEAHSLLKSEIKPYLKLGHDDKQALLQKDGLPSAGWVVNLKRVGDKLVADFKGIPKKIKELIEKKAYGRFSSEIYWDLKMGKEKHRRVLKAVALLGSDTPAVQNLDDFIALYTEDKLEYGQLKNYHELEGNSMDEKIYTMMENKVKEYELKIADKEKTIVQHVESINNLEGQVKKLTADIEAKEQEAKEKEIKLFIDEQVKAIKILPAQVEKYMALARKDFASVQELMKDMPKLVSTETESHQTQKPDKEKKYSEMNAEERDEIQDKKTKEYIAEHKDVKYKDALLIVQKQLESGE